MQLQAFDKGVAVTGRVTRQRHDSFAALVFGFSFCRMSLGLTRGTPKDGGQTRGDGLVEQFRRHPGGNGVTYVFFSWFGVWCLVDVDLFVGGSGDTHSRRSQH